MTYKLSIIRPRFDVENNSVRKKTFGNDSAVFDPSGPKKMTVGWVILTVPRRNSVSHAVAAEMDRASAEMMMATEEKIVVLLLRYHSAASTLFLTLPRASLRSSTGFKNCPV